MSLWGKIPFPSVDNGHTCHCPFSIDRSFLPDCLYLDDLKRNNGRGGYLPDLQHIKSTPPPITKYIVNGDIVSPNSHPYMVALFLDTIHFCGGSLVTPRHVITAAHCVAPLSSSKRRLGSE